MNLNCARSSAALPSMCATIPIVNRFDALKDMVQCDGLQRASDHIHELTILEDKTLSKRQRNRARAKIRKLSFQTVKPLRNLVISEGGKSDDKFEACTDQTFDAYTQLKHLIQTETNKPTDSDEQLTTIDHIGRSLVGGVLDFGLDFADCTVPTHDLNIHIPVTSCDFLNCAPNCSHSLSTPKTKKKRTIREYLEQESKNEGR